MTNTALFCLCVAPVVFATGLSLYVYKNYIFNNGK